MAIGGGVFWPNVWPFTMAIYNRKQDIPSEDGDGVVNWGPLTMAIFNKKQDMPSEDGDGGLHRGRLTMAIFIKEARYAIRRLILGC